MPNLENLRKQAKLYLRWHREGHHPVAAQIRAVLPRFRDLTDQAVLRQSFKLADAQELVARQSGFDSWQALKSEAQMTDRQTPSTATTPRLVIAEPGIVVTDFDRAVTYYTAKLGFEVVFTYGEPPFYGQVRRDGALINLRLVPEAVFVDGIREREEILAASITVGSAAEIRALFVEFQAGSVDFFRTLKQEPWGARTFIVRDPDGNLLLFAGPGT